MAWTQTFASGKMGDSDSFTQDNPIKVKKLTLTAQTTAAETDTGWSIPAGAVVLDVFVKVTTAEATGTTKTIDVGTMGTSNDPNGFVAQLSVAATGTFRPGATFTAGSNEKYLSASSRGELLADQQAGTDAATDVGTYSEKPCTTAAGDPVSWEAGSDQTEFAGELYIVYMVVN